MTGRYRRVAALICFVCCVLCSTLSVTAAVADQEKRHVIKVGYIDYDGFITEEKDGTYTGYGVEYLRKIAEYTGWEYEFEYDSWDQQLKKLETGEIDMICQAQRTKEREKQYLFSDYAIGAETSVLYVSKENDIYYYNDYAAYNGMRVGMLRDSFQNQEFRDYAAEKGFSYEESIYDTQEACFGALDRGEIDAVAMGSLALKTDYKIICRFGSDPFYIMTGRQNKELLAEYAPGYEVFNTSNQMGTTGDFVKIFEQNGFKMENMGKMSFFSNIIENHDEPRGVSHYLPEYAQNEKGKKLLGMMYFMLKGLPFIYQGQELGMENCAFPSIEAIDDVSSRDEYQRCLKVGLNEEEALKVVSHYSRDNGRTPFQWNDEKNGGFTTGTPWLMVNPQYKEINAASQIGREGSIYEFYKSMIALRRDDRYEDTIVYGVTEPVLEDQKDIMAYFRRGEKQDILVLGNFRDEAVEVEIPELKGKTCQVLLNNGGTCMAVDGRVKLEALQGVVFEIK